MEARGLEICDEIGIFSGNSNFHHYGQQVLTTSMSKSLTKLVKEGEDDDENSACMEVLVCGLQIASHLARNDEEYFPKLLQVFSDPLKLQWILSKVCLFYIILNL